MERNPLHISRGFHLFLSLLSLRSPYSQPQEMGTLKLLSVLGDLFIPYSCTATDSWPVSVVVRTDNFPFEGFALE